MMDMKCLVPFGLAVFCISGFGQQNGQNSIDSLEKKTYQYLREKLDDDLSADGEKMYSIAYLNKAKKEENWEELTHAYKLMLHLQAKPLRLAYADSMIIASKHSGKNDLIGSAYLTKGIIYYDEQNLTKALDNYLIADNYLTHTKDDYLKHKVKYNIAQIKYYLGYYPEAAKLFAENLAYFEYEDDLPYLTSLHSLALCYNRMGKYDLSTATTYKGIQEATERQYYEAIPRFINAEGINLFFKKNHTTSIANLNESLPIFRKTGDYAGEAVTYFYLGKNYWVLNERETAVRYFKMVVDMFAKTLYSYPDLRESYEFLIDYYKSEGDLEKQLQYIEQLLQVDKFLSGTYKYLSGRVHKEYDTKKLIAAKEEIEQTLELRRLLITCLIILVAILSMWLGYMIYKSQENRRRFKKVAERRAKPKLTPETKFANTNGLKINPEVIASVLRALDEFEASGRYLEKDMSLSKLAAICKSNIVYVSKIVSHSREKGVTDYINDLKIDYIITKLYENSRFRNYTNKALAEEAGFSTAQHFTRAFIKLNKVSPTDYVRELKRSMER